MDSEKKEENKEEEKIEEPTKEIKEEHEEKIDDDKQEEEKNEKEEKEEKDNKEEKEEKEENEENEEKENDKEDDNKENKKEKKKKNKKNKKEKKENNIIFSIDEENNICVDCEQKNPTKVSINNGVIICSSCALKHESLGPSISFIKDIEDDFDEYLLNFIVFGSNSKFKRFLIEEEIDPSLPIEKKYLTKACYFYRKNLKKKVQGENLELKKDYENGNEIMENNEENDEFEEFKNYKIKTKVIHEGVLKQKNINKLNKIGGNILNMGKKMLGGIKFGANYVEKKMEGGSKNILKQAGFYGKKIVNSYEKIKNNIMKKNNNENKNNKDDELKNNPPNLNEDNFPETKRPLQEDNNNQKENENNQEQKNENEDENNIDNIKDEKKEQNGENNEEKIDI